MLANFAAIEGAVVRDVGGGQRPQPPVELDLGAGQVSGHEVGHGPGVVLAGVAGGVEGAAGDHPPVVHSDIRPPSHTSIPHILQSEQLYD